MASVPDNVKKGDRLTAEHVRELTRLAKLGARPIRVVENSGLTLQDTPNGPVLGFDSRKTLKKVKAGAAGEIFQCKIVSISFSDYLVCHVIDEDGEQQDATYVAKPWFLRGDETWGGRTRVNVTYLSYASNYNVRTARPGYSTQKTQYLIPEYALGDIIFAMSCKATGVSRLSGDVSEPVEMIDVNADGRMWANA